MSETIEGVAYLLLVLFLDGHSSHLSLELSEFCKENRIIIVALFPNATHILQPQDVSVFGPMKQKWKKICRQWRIGHDGQEVGKPKRTFAIIFNFRDTIKKESRKSNKKK